VSEPRPQRFVDVHVHVLPGLDDGPATMEEAVAMLRTAHGTGTRVLVATPHMFTPAFGNFDPEAVRRAFAGFLAALDEYREREEFVFLDELELCLGAENYLSTEFLQALDEGNLIALNNGGHLLIEFPPMFAFEMALSAIERIQAAGFTPVLAHVERYPFLQHDPARIEACRELGALTQLNARTLLGDEVDGIVRRAREWVRRGQVDLIASDAHGVHRRRPDLSRAAERLSGPRSPDAATLLWKNPLWVLGARGRSDTSRDARHESVSSPHSGGR